MHVDQRVLVKNSKKKKSLKVSQRVFKDLRETKKKVYECIIEKSAHGGIKCIQDKKKKCTEQKKKKSYFVFSFGDNRTAAYIRANFDRMDRQKKRKKYVNERSSDNDWKTEMEGNG